MHGVQRGVIAALTTVAFVLPCLDAPAHAGPSLLLPAARCGMPPASTVQSVGIGHLYLSDAYQALSRDRARFAGLGPQRRSAALSAVAEAHSAYMAAIGSWADGDPAGGILARVRAAGLIDAVYAGQNVVTASGSTVPEAIRNGEAFFAGEAAGGGPHWDNITNPNHHYVGMGLSVLGSPGAYTIYLTQVFSDVGGCATQSEDQLATASSNTTALRPGVVAHPSVDELQLRSEPQGMVIGTLHRQDRLKVIDVQGNWAHVRVLAGDLYGWVYAPFLTT